MLTSLVNVLLLGSTAAGRKDFFGFVNALKKGLHVITVSQYHYICSTSESKCVWQWWEMNNQLII